MKKLILLVLSILFVISCKKCDDDQIVPVPLPLTQSDFFPLKEGNYWVYETSRLDTNGIVNENFSRRIDSLFVLGDSIVGDKVYTTIYRELSTLNTTVPILQLMAALRIDSGNIDYLYTSPIWFTSFTTMHNDTLFKDTSMFNNRIIFSENVVNAELGNVISTPAGDFMEDVIDVQYISREPDSEKEWRRRRVSHNYYKKDVGLIVKSYFYASGIGAEVKLMRYQIVE